MSLVIDIGNTRIKWAEVDDGGLRGHGQAAHLDDFEAAFEKLAAALPKQSARVVVANVAGERFAKRLAELVRLRFRIEPELVVPTAERFGVRCGYANPARLGADRWCATLAAHRLAGAACVIGAGTAVTFDAVGADGRHLGGLIFAGPRLVADALERSTSNVGATALADAAPRGAALLGTNTDAAVGHAALLGVAAAIDRAVATVGHALGATPTVFLTGGDAARLRGWLETATQERADLVLEGLALFAREPERRG
jgi:type III pantothenate kinase